MRFTQKRRAGGRVTPSFIRNIRKGYLHLDGRPKEGCEQRAAVLLDVLTCVQEGEYHVGMKLAQRQGIPIDRMYKDYRRMRDKCHSTNEDLFDALSRFCQKHGTPIRVRFA